jgi:hypothetical protein
LYLNSKNSSKIGAIVATKDSHVVDHIAHARVWSSTEDGKGERPPPFTQICFDDIGW